MRSTFIFVPLIALLVAGTHRARADKNTPCTDAKTKIATGELVLRSCVTKQHEETYGTVATTSRVTLTFRPLHGRAVSAELGTVDKHWEWEESWTILGTLTDEQGQPGAAVLVRTASGREYEAQRVEIRGLGGKLPTLWRSTDDLFENELRLEAASLHMKAKQLTPKADIDKALPKTAFTQATLTYRAGKIDVVSGAAR